MLALLVNLVTKVLAYGFLMIFSLWCWYQWTKWDFLRAAKKLPCTVTPLPILGHAHLLLKGYIEFWTWGIKAFPLAAVSKGLYNVCFWVGPIPFVMVHKLEDIQKILNSTSTAEKAFEYDYMNIISGSGLLTNPGHIWKITRRHISPLFHSSNIEQLMVVFNKNSRELVADLAEHVDGEPVDMLHPAMSVALKTVCQVIFGSDLDFDRKSKAFQCLMEVVEESPAILMKRFLNPFLRIDIIFKFLYRNKLNQINDVWKDFTESPLKVAKTNYLKKCKELTSRYEESNTSLQGSLTLVDVYTEMQKKYPQFTEKDLKSEMVTLYLTGTDTVGLATSSCLLALGTYHDIQDRLYEEIIAVVGPDNDVTMDHISRMQYLDQVYKETLRWSFVVPYIGRRTTEELKLSDCTIPAGNDVLVGLIGLHIDPNIWPNPLQFDPEHFSPENTAIRPKHAFMPFSSGSRMCIGKTYSEQLTKTMLVHVLRKYRVSTDMDIHNLKKKYAVTNISSEGYLIKFNNRKLK